MWTLALNNQLTVAPAYAADRAFFAIADDRLVSYALAAGSLEWTISVHPLHDLSASEDLVFIVEAGALTARRQADGSVAWTVPLDADLAAAPAWDNGWLIAETTAGDVLAFRANDGTLVWRQTLGSPSHTPAALAADRVYVATDDGRVVALRVDSGAIVWTRRLGGPATAILALDNQVFAGSTDNFFYCLDAPDGTVSWRWRTGADLVGVPVVDERYVYFVSLDNVLRALARSHGVQQWARPLPLRPTRGPLRVGDTLVITGIARTVRAYNMKDGTPAGDLAPGAEIAAPPAVVLVDGLPSLLIVTRDIAKGATATLFTRDVEPKPTPIAPLPNLVKPGPLPGGSSGTASSTPPAR